MSSALVIDDDPALADLSQRCLERAVMVTSFTRDKDAARGRELGADDYIVKPLMESDFLNRIRRLARHK